GQYQQPAYPMYPPQQPFVMPPQNQRPQQDRYKPRNQYEPRNTYEKKIVHFDRVPLPYGQILPYLLQKGMVEFEGSSPGGTSISTSF
ncbi:hypothetical protein A2U01_0077167, partial [Trifolium medium]|nr:hypothetical protein [Trifolium medium]